MDHVRLMERLPLRSTACTWGKRPSQPSRHWSACHAHGARKRIPGPIIEADLFHIPPVGQTEGRGEQRCLSLSHLWQRPAARGFDKLVGIFLATSDEKSKLLPVVLFLDVYSDCYE
jgi:hypothetical protein